MAWELCSKEDVKALTPVPVTKLKDTWSELTEGMIREHLGMSHLGKMPERIENEVLSGNGTPILRPKHLPIFSVETINVNGMIYTQNDVLIRPTMIHLKHGSFPVGVGNITITYLAGSEDVPENVRFTAVQMIIALLSYYNRSGADSSVKWAAITDEKIGKQSQPIKTGLVPYIRAVMLKNLDVHRIKVG